MYHRRAQSWIDYKNRCGSGNVYRGFLGMTDTFSSFYLFTSQLPPFAFFWYKKSISMNVLEGMF